MLGSPDLCQLGWNRVPLLRGGHQWLALHVYSRKRDNQKVITPHTWLLGHPQRASSMWTLPSFPPSHACERKASKDISFLIWPLVCSNCVCAHITHNTPRTNPHGSCITWYNMCAHTQTACFLSPSLSPNRKVPKQSIETVSQNGQGPEVLVRSQGQRNTQSRLHSWTAGLLCVRGDRAASSEPGWWSKSLWFFSTLLSLPEHLSQLLCSLCVLRSIQYLSYFREDTKCHFWGWVPRISGHPGLLRRHGKSGGC
jgi:hypothetical protein